MPWIKTVPLPHRCSPPAPLAVMASVGPGSVWECEECGQHWVLEKDWSYSKVPKTKRIKEAP